LNVRELSDLGLVFMMGGALLLLARKIRRDGKGKGKEM
jgi:hypothetical protein